MKIYPNHYPNKEEYDYTEDYNRIDENVSMFKLLKEGNDDYLEQIKDTLRGD